MTGSRGVLPSLRIGSKRLFTYALLANCWIAGCAVPVQPLVTGDTPAEILPTGAQIVADQQSIQLYGFELTPEEWADLKEQRSAVIHGEVGPGAMGGAAGGALGGLLYLCAYPPACPFAIGIGAVAGGTAGATASALEGAAQAPWFIPPDHGSRLAATFNALATGDSLRERVLRFAGPAAIQTANAVELPRLVVRMHSARLDPYSDASFAIALTAHAQVFPCAGEGWRLTQHTYQSPPRSLAEWTARKDKHVRRELDEGLDALAKNIVSRYELR